MDYASSCCGRHTFPLSVEGTGKADVIKLKKKGLTDWLVIASWLDDSV